MNDIFDANLLILVGANTRAEANVVFHNKIKLSSKTRFRKIIYGPSIY